MTDQQFTHVQTATLPGTPGKPSEDWIHATSDLVVVLDGATVRTDTGCVHGVHWYAARLGAALVELAAQKQVDLATVLSNAITRVAGEHRECDLQHPGTPSAGVAILRPDGRYLVLGDVTVVAESTEGPTVIVDPRVDMVGRAERDEVDRHLIGSPEKAQALIPMKRAELAARNIPGGYWIAAADPQAAQHALTGTIDLSRRAAVLTDGATRAVSFGLMTWTDLLSIFAEKGPEELLAIVRQAEADDPLGKRWPRNKVSDDATAAFITGN